MKRYMRSCEGKGKYYGTDNETDRMTGRNMTPFTDRSSLLP